MKSWEFTKIVDNKIRIDKWLASIMGLVEGGYIYSTLFKYPEGGPKRYELLLSMYPQENFRTLSHVNIFMEDTPGSTVQSARFLSSRGVNVLNSVSLNGISDTTIIWSLMAELNFAGEGELIKEQFTALKAAGDPSVDKIKYISIKPAKIGRIFRKESDSGTVKEELRHGAPVTFTGGTFDLSVEYGDILTDIEGSEVMLILDTSSWIVSIVFFDKDTRLIEVNMRVPDRPGSIDKALGILAESGVNLISVFSKIVIAYQVMSLEVVADMKGSRIGFEELPGVIRDRYRELRGVYELEGIRRLG
jgi:hypothetical protein